MSRLTVFTGCVIVVVIIAAFMGDYSHTHNQLTQARADLATALHDVAQCQAARQSAETYAAALRGQASASQQNCVQTLFNSQKLFDLALLAPLSPVPDVTTNNQPSGASDAAFTDFLNAW